MHEKLHHRIGPQCILLGDVERKGDLFMFQRPALEKLWAILNDLQEASKDLQKQDVQT